MNIKILINRTDAIGDTLLTLPMISVLKKNIPNVHITLLVSVRSFLLIEHCTEIDSILMLPVHNKFKFLRELHHKEKFTHYFYVGGSHLVSLVSFFSRVPFRGGLLSRWPSFIFLNHGVRQVRSKAELHESQYNLNLLSPLLQKPILLSNVDYPQLIVSEMEEKSVNLLLDRLDIRSNHYVVIHPGMTGHTLNWPMANYAQLIKNIFNEYHEMYRLIVSFTPVDLPFIKELKTELMKLDFDLNNILFLDGAVAGIRQYLAVLSKSRLFIGPSTGTTHMAAALQKNVITFYSPVLVQSAKRWSPLLLKDQLSLFSPDVPCPATKKCLGDVCEFFPCMQKIEVSTILEKVREMITKGS